MHLLRSSYIIAIFLVSVCMYVFMCVYSLRCVTRCYVAGALQMKAGDSDTYSLSDPIFAGNLRKSL